MDNVLAKNLADNIKQLREQRGYTQQHSARLSAIPRATWANIEGGGGNPTLTVLSKIATALQVSIEELVSPPKAQVEFFSAGFGSIRNFKGGSFRPLIPETITGLEISRVELNPGAHVTGVPHTNGTREYLSCELGRIQLSLAGKIWTLKKGEALAFRGDQKHAYTNPDKNNRCIAFSVVCFAR